MVSAANLAAIEAAGHVYLSAVDRDALASVPLWDRWSETIPADDWQAVLMARGWVPDDAEATLWYREAAESAYRWVFAFDYARWRLELAVQAQAIAAVEAWVAQKTRTWPRRAATVRTDPCAGRSTDLLHRKHLTAIIHYTLTPFARPSEATQGRTAV